MRFYVYTSTKDELEFIDEECLEQFAAHEFDLAIHKFSGVAIDAEDINDALISYCHPTSTHGEYLMIDEPQATVTRRDIELTKNGLQESFNQVKAKLEYLRACIKIQVALTKMHEANKLMNEAANELFVVHHEPTETPPAVIFKRISDAAVNIKIKYHGDTKKTG